MNLTAMTKEQLQAKKQELEAAYRAACDKGLKLDMSRGKPGADQLDLSAGLLEVLKTDEDLFDGKTDTRNYGILDGLPSCRKLFAQLLEVPVENIMAGGNASLTMMYDTMLRLWVFGASGTEQPWSKLPQVKWLCPTPGYDRHFAICQQLGMEMIPVPMTATGPDMDVVESLAASDESIKGIWCVPKYSNPEGITYSDETVLRFAQMKTAAPDFKIFWDNAYCVHDLYPEGDSLLNAFEACQKAGNPDRLLMFASTSKITYPGGGVACMAASDADIAWTKKIMTVQAIGPDKINQLRHVRFFQDAAGVRAHMAKHAAILAPKFEMVADMLEKNLGGTGAGSWRRPRGGYFISFDSYPGCARRIHALCREAGVILTDAGATWPLGKDPQDKNLRLAPSLPPVSELQAAMEVFCICVLLACTEALLAR